MSRAPHHKNDTFKLFQPDEDLLYLQEVTHECISVFHRLSGVFIKALAVVINAGHLLSKPVKRAVTATRVALTLMVSEQKQVAGQGHGGTILLAALYASAHRTPAIVTEFPRTAQHLRTPSRVCNILERVAGSRPHLMDKSLPEPMAQMQFTGHWLAADFLKR
jgi:hypothetical protein